MQCEGILLWVNVQVETWLAARRDDAPAHDTLPGARQGASNVVLVFGGRCMLVFDSAHESELLCSEW